MAVRPVKNKEAAERRICQLEGNGIKAYGFCDPERLHMAFDRRFPESAWGVVWKGHDQGRDLHRIMRDPKVTTVITSDGKAVERGL